MYDLQEDRGQTDGGSMAIGNLRLRHAVRTKVLKSSGEHIGYALVNSTSKNTDNDLHIQTSTFNHN